MSRDTIMKLYRTTKMTAPGQETRPKGSCEPLDRKRRDFTTLCALLICCLGICFAPLAAQGKTLYQNDFELAEVGKAPDDFLILEGGFVVKQEDGNRFLELPGAPL